MRTRTLIALAVVTATTGCGAAAGAAPAAQIAFMRPGTIGEFDLWAVRPDGTGLRRLTTAPRDRSDYNPAWSPDHRTLLFERRGDFSDDDIGLVAIDADGSRYRNVTECTGDCWGDGEGAWSADGRRVAFGRASGPRDAPIPALIAIEVAGADGTGIRQVSSPPPGWEDHYPTWAPDGRTIVFERDKSTNPAGPSMLVALDVASRRERIVYRLPDWAPSAGVPKFSPDGRRILFGYWCVFGDQCPASTRSHRNATLATIAPDGRHLHRLRLPSDADSGAWSPDGSHIVYRCRGEGGATPFRICTSRLDGGDFRRFPWEVDSAHPSWG